MALITCDECSKEFSDTLNACPHCGKKLNNYTDSVKTTLFNKLQQNNKIVLAILIILILGVVGVRQFYHSHNKTAVENCKKIISTLKDPDSFKLYGDIENIQVYNGKDDTLEGEYMYIDYGAANSYGGMVRSLVAFDEKGYIGDIQDNLGKDDFESNDRYLDYAKATAYKVMYTIDGERKNGDSYYLKKKIIPKDNIIKKIK